ncbi:hypothetical protein AAVH_28152 [Aphelenchoides avenae]|nr:hypothetical protein AAVH_28152 [Aphelenchus avenae]
MGTFDDDHFTIRFLDRVGWFFAFGQFASVHYGSVARRRYEIGVESHKGVATRCSIGAGIRSRCNLGRIL